MQKRILFILVLIIAFGCKMKYSIESDFEKSIPKQDLIILNKLVKSFDLLVEDQYGGDAEHFFRAVKNGSVIFDEKNKNDNCQLIQEFEKSTLEYKSENLPYDTVYASQYYKDDEEVLNVNKPIIITINQDQDTSSEEGIIIFGEQTIEKQIEQVKNDGYLNQISESSFVGALIKAKIKNMDVVKYIDRKQSVVLINPKSMATGVLKLDIDFSNYFIKRIIVFEIFRQQIKKEYGC